MAHGKKKVDRKRATEVRVALKIARMVRESHRKKGLTIEVIMNALGFEKISEIGWLKMPRAHQYATKRIGDAARRKEQRKGTNKDIAEAIWIDFEAGRLM